MNGCLGRLLLWYSVYTCVLTSLSLSFILSLPAHCRQIRISLRLMLFQNVPIFNCECTAIVIINYFIFISSYSVIWNEHFEQCALGWSIKLSSKSYNLAILVIKGAPHLGHFSPPAPFKISSFKLSITSCETV